MSKGMTNAESRRQFYLGAAGIRMWYAKRPLPGAAASHAFGFDEGPTSSAPDINAPVDIPALASDTVILPQKPSRQKAVDLQALMAPETGKKDTKAGASPAGMSAEAPEPLLALTCHLAIWSTESYLLISQWSDETSERLQDGLANNLLKALEQRQVNSRQMLHWPVFRNPQMPGNSAGDFRDVLEHVMAPARPFGSVILLGVLNEVPEEHRSYCLGPILSAVGVDFSYSLAALSTIPALKRELWGALRSCYSV